MTLPRSLAAGRFYVRVCVRAGRRADCRFATRRITIVRPTTSPTPPGGPPAEPPVDYDILAFTEGSAANDSVGDAVSALRELGRSNRFRVTVASSSNGVFTETNLKRYRAVLFLNTAGDVLDAAEQTAFENYFKDGGGFLGIHSAIATEPDWQFMTDLLGTRATGAAAATDDATIKVADRVHDASKSLPEYWSHTRRATTTSRATCAASRTCSPPSTRRPTPAARWASTIRSPGARTRGRPLLLHGAWPDPQAYRSTDFREHLMGAIAWTAGVADPVYSDCGATVLANYQQVKITAPPNLNEPIGFDQLPDGRILQTTRDGRVRLHDPETGSADVIAQIPVYPTARTACTGRRSTTTSPATGGCTSTTRR